MKRASANRRTLISAATTPEFFTDIAFALISETAVEAKTPMPVVQTQLFATAEILSFPPTKLDCHNRANFSNERREA